MFPGHVCSSQPSYQLYLFLSINSFSLLFALPRQDKQLQTPINQLHVNTKAYLLMHSLTRFLGRPSP